MHWKSPREPWNIILSRSNSVSLSVRWVLSVKVWTYQGHPCSFYGSLNPPECPTELQSTISFQTSCQLIQCLNMCVYHECSLSQVTLNKTGFTIQWAEWSGYWSWIRSLWVRRVCVRVAALIWSTAIFNAQCLGMRTSLVLLKYFLNTRGYIFLRLKKNKHLLQGK